MQTVSNGLLVDRTTDGALATTHWRSTSPMASYLAFFALGHYDVEQGVRDGLPWYVATSADLDPDRERLARQSLMKGPAITAWLARRLGRYPFESTGGLTTALPVEFALENQTRPTYASSFGGDTSVVVHELAHQWFGDSVSVRRWRDIWLNEGLATFMEAAYAETHGGKPAQKWLRRQLQDLRRYAAPAYWRLDLADPGPHHLFDDQVYERGGLALQALRNRIGDRDFWAVLHAWVREHRYGVATVPQFEALAERTSGEQLDGFFRAWLRAPRPPAATRANGLR
jgi:aminopeptidase N